MLVEAASLIRGMDICDRRIQRLAAATEPS
jgi:hypothetical protein